jgi:hypothetical protein
MKIQPILDTTLINGTEMCPSEGHKGHMPLINQIRGGKYAPDEKNPKHTSEVEFKIQKCRIYIKLMQGRIHTCLE